MTALMMGTGLSCLPLPPKKTSVPLLLPRAAGGRAIRAAAVPERGDGERGAMLLYQLRTELK